MLKTGRTLENLSHLERALRQQVKSASIFWLAFAGLFVYALTLIAITGDIGFQGDDWHVFSVPYWHSFPGSVWVFARELGRPLEGLYWITLFEIFGFSKIFFHLFSLLLLAGACLLMGACLASAFAGKHTFVASSMLFAFFLPTVSSLTYVMHTDNSRLCLLFFWGSVLAFQRWAARSQSWVGLGLPVLLYYLAILTYDAAILLIFVVPFFVWPVRLRRRDRLSDGTLLFRLTAGILAGLVLFALAWVFVFRGGAVGLRYLVPPLGLAWSYLATLPLYVLAPFAAVSLDAWTWAVGLLVMLFVAALLFRADGHPGRDVQDEDGGREQGLWYVALLGGGVLGLGMLPYLFAGYGAGLGFYAHSRIYSAGSFGLAMLLGLLTTAWKNRWLLLGAKLVAVIAIGLMAMFQMDLRKDWQESARMNCELWTSFIEQAPDVTPGTTFLFLDLQSYIGNRAVVFGGTSGLREYIRILYDRRDLNAYYLYLYSDEFVDSEGRLATASSAGVVARGSPRERPIPLDSLLIFQRQGAQLVLLDSISAGDRLAAIRWEDVSVIHSNPELILPASEAATRWQEVCCTWRGR